MIAQQLILWGIRGAATGLGVDLAVGVCGKRIDGRNLLINLVHGLAIGVISATFGSAIGFGAFIASCILLPPVVLLENIDASRDQILRSIALRTIALLFGSVVGSLF